MRAGFEGLAAALNQAGVRYVVIGVAGANYWARSAHTIFTTKDFDLLLPPDADNAMKAWDAAEAVGLALYVGEDSLDRPRAIVLAERIVERRALVRATDGRGLDVDLTMEMAGFDFDGVFPRRRTFLVEGVPIPVASLRDIVASKAAAGREKDHLFLVTHAEALRSLAEDEPDA